MVYFYVTFFVLVIAATIAMYFTKVYKSENPMVEKIAKIVVISWMALHFINLFLPDSFAMRTFDNRLPYESGKDIWFAIFRWCNDVAFIVLPVAVFFKKNLFKKITAYFLLIACLANVIVYFKYMQGYTSPNGAGIMALRFFNEQTKAFFINPVFRSIYFGLSMFLELTAIIFITMRSGKELAISKDKKSMLLGFGAFFAIFLSILPIYVPQYLFKGYALVGNDFVDNFKMGSLFHILWIIGVVVEGFVITKVFKKRDADTKFIVVLTLALSLLMQYHQMFTGIGEITAHRMPFQLCNIAGLFIILMLITKNEKLYHFTIVINSVGAIIAMILCDTTPYGLTYIMNIHYVTEHTNVILVPILCATLGLFKPLQNKDIKDFIAGFTIYFVAILIIGGTFTGLYNTTGNDYWNCNYLFIFNKAETLGIVGFVGPLFDAKITLFNFYTLSLVQLVVYVVFTIICTGVFFLIKFLTNKSFKKQNALA